MGRVIRTRIVTGYSDGRSETKVVDQVIGGGMNSGNISQEEMDRINEEMENFHKNMKDGIKGAIKNAMKEAVKDAARKKVNDIGSKLGGLFGFGKGDGKKHVK